MKLDFHKKARDNIKAIGSGGTIKKHNCSLLKLKLPILAELGKLETHATLTIFDLFTLLSLVNNRTNSLMHAASQ